MQADSKHGKAIITRPANSQVNYVYPPVYMYISDTMFICILKCISMIVIIINIRSCNDYPTAKNCVLETS